MARATKAKRSKAKSRAAGAKQPKAESPGTNPFQLRRAQKEDRDVHVFGRNNNVVCDTDTRGRKTPEGKDPFSLVVDASEGFIPLWARETTLRWRFQERSLRALARPAAAKAEIRRLFGEALVKWGDAAPIKFAERTDAWDFEIVVRDADRCSVSGCVLASAFFPDAGRHELRIYPRMFGQSRQEQVETMIHEIGHVFGLRHFFANISETEWRSVLVGTHNRFTIMNYGADSRLTETDRSDLKDLYRRVWSGEVREINGTTVRLVRPFHTAGALPDSLQVRAALQPQATADAGPA